MCSSPGVSIWAPVDPQPRTALHHLAAKAVGSTLRLFLARADRAVVHARDAAGATPLHAAAVGGWDRPGVIGALLAVGADPSSRDGSGRTPLDCARAAECTAAIEVLEALERSV